MQGNSAPNNAFGDMIYRRRRALNMTQERLAELVKVKPTYIGYLERGKRHASPRVLGELATHLGLNRSYVFLTANPIIKEFLTINDAFEVTEAPLPQSLLDLAEDKALRATHGIGDEEMTVLKRCSFLGEARDKQDWVFFWETIKRLFRTESAPQGRTGAR